MKRHLLWLGLAALVVGCWALRSEAITKRDLEIEVQSLRTMVEEALAREEKYQKEVIELSEKVSELLDDKRGSQASAGVDLLQMQQELSTLSQQIIEDRRVLEDIDKKLSVLIRNSDQELRELRKRVRGLELAAGMPSGPGEESGLDLKDYTEVYQLAMDQYRMGKKDAAKEQFEAFLKAYPQTDLSDNALFMIGEYFFELGDYEKAIIHYDDVRKKYHKENKVPNAMWKMALAFDKLGDRKTAVLFLKEIVKKHPQTNEADLAGRQLKEWK